MGQILRSLLWTLVTSGQFRRSGQAIVFLVVSISLLPLAAMGAAASGVGATPEWRERARACKDDTCAALIAAVAAAAAGGSGSGADAFVARLRAQLAADKVGFVLAAAALCELVALRDARMPLALPLPAAVAAALEELQRGVTSGGNGDRTYAAIQADKERWVHGTADVPTPEWGESRRVTAVSAPRHTPSHPRPGTPPTCAPFSPFLSGRGARGSKRLPLDRRLYGPRNGRRDALRLAVRAARAPALQHECRRRRLLRVWRQRWRTNRRRRRRQQRRR